MKPEPLAPHGDLIAALSRRELLRRAAVGGAGALALASLPGMREVLAAAPAQAAPPDYADATLQAFADTIIPGRKATRTDLGNDIDARAIAGVDPLPGAVEADALALFHHPLTGFDALEAPFLAELELRATAEGGDFIALPFEARVRACVAGLSFDNPLRLLWEAAAAVPFTAFCAAAIAPAQTAAKASGYRVMGLPGAAPAGYRAFSYRRKLATERTKHGYLD